MKRRTVPELVGVLVALAVAGLSAAGSGVAYLAIELKTNATVSAVNPVVLGTPILPGWVMKIATIAAALESGVVGDRTGILCTREVTVSGHKLTCTHPDFHRPLQPAEALAHSCNVFAATVATRLSRGALDRALTSLGLRPSDARWPVAPSGLGIEGNRVAPRKLVDMMARIAAEPSLLPWSPTTLRVIREGLKGAARQGTASALVSRGVDAKTGTVVKGGVEQGLIGGAAPVGCTNLLGPDGPYTPKDPGTLVVRVRDQSGAPVRGARVSVEMPNSVGSFFTESSQTDSSGTHTFYYVPAANRRVEVAPPSGFAASAPAVIQEVHVVKGESTTADFTLVRIGG